MGLIISEAARVPPDVNKTKKKKHNGLKNGDSLCESKHEILFSIFCGDFQVIPEYNIIVISFTYLYLYVLITSEVMAKAASLAARVIAIQCSLLILIKFEITEKKDLCKNH